MLSVQAGADKIDYKPCRYGASRSLFRGPARDLSQPYVAMLGGAATFGKHVPRPYSDLVELATGVTCVNLGVPGAGPDVYLSDPAVLEVVAGARAAVVQLSGAEAVSNPYYTVHSRRNDRFVAATPALRSLYPEVDFTEIHFTRHLLAVLARIDARRFAVVRSRLQVIWVRRMRALLSRLPPRRLLLCLAEVAPDGLGGPSPTAPLFVEPWMLDELAPLSVGLIRAPATVRGDTHVIPETEAMHVTGLPGIVAHQGLARGLLPHVRPLLADPGPPLLLRDAVSAAEGQAA